MGCARRGRLTVFAAVALIPWLLTPSSQIEPSPITPNWAAATPLQPASAVRQASAPSYAPTSTLGSVCPVLSEESWTVRFVGAHTARHRVRLVLPEQPCPMHSGETQLAGLAARVRSRVGWHGDPQSGHPAEVHTNCIGRTHQPQQHGRAMRTAPHEPRVRTIHETWPPATRTATGQAEQAW